MGVPRHCYSCRSTSLVTDDVSSNIVCSSCGTVQQYEAFENTVFTLHGMEGTFVNVGTTGSGGSLIYKEKKIYEAKRLIDDIMYRLGLAGARCTKVKDMIYNITEGEFGQGVWFEVLIGACAYISMRKDNLALPMAAVTSVVGCDVYELGRMIKRVVEFLDLKQPEFPEFDIVIYLKRILKDCPFFSGIEAGTRKQIEEQGVFLVQCAVKWFLTTGRRPLPMVVAVLVLVAEVNQVKVGIEDLARKVDAVVSTCRTRYKELLRALVEAAKALPWGKDVTVKNIVKNAPMVIQYMEKMSMSNPPLKSKDSDNGIDLDMNDMVDECLRKDAGYGYDTAFQKDSQYFQVRSNERSNEGFAKDVDKLNISHECLFMMYKTFLNDVRSNKSTGWNLREHKREKQLQHDPLWYMDWWDGKSELSKKVLLKELLEKNVGFEAMPPSFVSGCLKNERRRQKIRDAKLRINRVLHPLSSDNSKKRKAMDIETEKNIDWEDLIIETLLLHQVKEEEIEKGHYNTLLDLHVFNSGIV